MDGQEHWDRVQMPREARQPIVRPVTGDPKGREPALRPSRRCSRWRGSRLSCAGKITTRGRTSPFRNSYDDADYAQSYSGLEWGATYHLVRPDLPAILSEHVGGRRAQDFGCGSGRSSRRLRSCGFEVLGVDIAPSMTERARQLDPAGDHRVPEDGDLTSLRGRAFDLVLAAFPFDNTPATEKPRMLRALRERLATNGRHLSVVSSPEIYVHEWASFSTRDYPEKLALGEPECSNAG